MASLPEKVRVELDNITLVLDELRNTVNKPDKSIAELAGIGAFLNNFYTGVENILKQLFAEKKIAIPGSGSWHKELLEQAVKNQILTETTKSKLGKFLVFRHFFIHGYSFMIDEEEIKPLAHLAPEVFSDFRNEIQRHMLIGEGTQSK